MPCTRSPISSERSGAAGPAHRQLYSARSREPRGAALSTHAKRSRSRTSFVPAIESTWGECPPASAPRMPAEIGLPVTTGTELQRGAPLVPDSREQGGTPQSDRLRAGLTIYPRHARYSIVIACAKADLALPHSQITHAAQLRVRSRHDRRDSSAPLISLFFSFLSRPPAPYGSRTQPASSMTCGHTPSVQG